MNALAQKANCSPCKPKLTKAQKKVQTIHKLLKELAKDASTSFQLKQLAIALEAVENMYFY